MIYDCFSYWDEDLLLDLRLNILDKYIDYFVIVEGNKTWQNNPKQLRFDIQKFQRFKNKIIYIPITDMPSGEDPYLRENYQRNSISRGLKNAKDSDIILISDLDEIPNPNSRQKHFYYKFNLQSENYPFWNGTRVCVKKYLKSPQWLRNLKFKKRPFWRLDKIRLNNIIEDGGWHFCNLKTPENLLYKYKNLCETNDPVHFKESIDPKYLKLEEVKKRIVSGEDIIGRKDNFIKVNLDSSFPEYLTKNKDNYKDWII